MNRKDQKKIKKKNEKFFQKSILLNSDYFGFDKIVSVYHI